MQTGMPEVDRLLAEVGAAAAAKYGAAAVARIAASTLPSFEPTRWEDERQRPTWVHTPGLASRPFWTREQCGRLTEMIVAFEQARDRNLRWSVDVDPLDFG